VFLNAQSSKYALAIGCGAIAATRNLPVINYYRKELSALQNIYIYP
jgi:hypothetical protein